MAKTGRKPIIGNKRVFQINRFQEVEMVISCKFGNPWFEHDDVRVADGAVRMVSFQNWCLAPEQDRTARRKTSLEMNRWMGRGRMGLRERVEMEQIAIVATDKLQVNMVADGRKLPARMHLHAKKQNKIVNTKSVSIFYSAKLFN
jgi:hypothetical protein